MKTKFYRCLAGLLMMTSFVINAQNYKNKPNILFIAVDDMADWAGYLGHPDVKTPNIDRLANRGIAFTNTQCTSPICGREPRPQTQPAETDWR